MDKNKKLHSGSHARLILSKGSWYFLASFVTKVINIPLMRVITNYLSPSEMGTMKIVEYFVMLMPLFISIQLDAAYFRFFFKHNKTQDELKTYISTYFWFIFVWGIFLTGGCMLVGKFYLTGRLGVVFFPYLVLIFLSPLILQLGALGQSYLKGNIKSELFGIIQISVYVVYIILYIVLLVVFKMGIYAKLSAIFVQNVLLSVLYFSVLMKDRLVGFRFDKKILIEGLKYSIPLLPNEAASWITGLSDRIIVEVIKDAHDTGIYDIGYFIGQQLTIFTNAIFSVYTTLMFSMMTENKEEGIKKVERFFPDYFFIMFWFAFLIGVFSKEAVLILTDPKYHAAYVVTPIVAYAYFFGAMYKPFVNIISFHNKTWIISTGSLFQAASNVVFNFVFIPRFGMIAAAWTTLGSLAIYFMWIFLWSQRFEKIKIDWKRVILTLVLGGICFGVIKGIGTFLTYHIVISILYKTLVLFCALGAAFALRLITVEKIKMLIKK